MRNYKLRPATIHSERRPCGGSARPGEGWQQYTVVYVSNFHRQTIQERDHVGSGPGQGWHPPGHFCHLWLLLPYIPNAAATPATEPCCPSKHSNSKSARAKGLVFPAKIRGEHPWAEVILTLSKDLVQTDERGLWALLLALVKIGSRRTAGKGAGPGPETNPFLVSQGPSYTP